jgi:cysteine desulfurase
MCIRDSFRNAYFHIDAVQSFGKISLNVENLGIDCLSASAHKIYGPKGIGFAYIRSQTPMSALILGGGQERNRRAGTENVAAIVGFAEAVKIAQENMNSNYDYVQGLNDYLWKGLNEAGISGLFRNSGINSSPYILSITFDPEIYSNDSEAMSMFMDLNGIAVSSGSACSSGTLKPSHVITAAGHSVDYARGTMRISFSPENTRSELDYAIEQIKKMADRNRK